jgi:enediyne biosynthesis protein E4
MPRVRIFLVAISVALAAGAVFWLSFRADPPPAPPFPVRFTDVTDEAGIRFRHFNGAAGKKLLPETMGSGVAVIDFDRDGRPDLVFVNSRPWPGQLERPTQALYRNRGDGTFEDVTARMGLDVELFGMGVAVADYDNDGWPDILITAVGGNRLFRNRGGERFEDVTAAAGLGSPAQWGTMSAEAFLALAQPISFPSSAAWLDFDGDGRLDLFVCNYLSWSPAVDLAVQAVLPGGIRAYVPPTEFRAVQCQLYRNIDGTRFEDVTDSSGIKVVENGAAVGKALGVAVCDPDNDGWPDIVVACDMTRNLFYHNVAGASGRRFDEMGHAVNVAYAEARPRGGMGIDSAEVLPGTLAIAVVNFSNEPNSLFQLRSAQPIRFIDSAVSTGLAGMSRTPMKFGALFLDVDLDGRPDLFTANGHLEPDIATAQGGHTYAQSAQLFWNTGDPARLWALATREEIGDDLFRPIVGRGCAYLDFDGDGDLDLVVTENGGRARLFRNDNATGHHWIAFSLAGNGSTSNRDAIGAEITLEVGGRVQRRYVTGSRGYLSQSDLTATFGLGPATSVEKVTVRWPGRAGGTRSWENLAAGKRHLLAQ